MDAANCGYCKRDLTRTRQAGNCPECQRPLCVVCFAQGQRNCLEHKTQARPAAAFTCDRCSKNFPAVLLAGQCAGREEEPCDRPICRNCLNRYAGEGGLLCRFHQPGANQPVSVLHGLPGGPTVDPAQTFLLRTFFARLEQKLAEVSTVTHPRTGQPLRLDQFYRRQPSETVLQLVHPARNNRRGLGIVAAVNFNGAGEAVQAAVDSALKLNRQESQLDVFLALVAAGASWNEPAWKWFTGFDHPEVTLGWLEWHGQDGAVKVESKYRQHPAFQSLLALFRLEAVEEMVGRAIEWLRRDTDWLLGERSFSQAELVAGLEISPEQVQRLLVELARRQIGRVDQRQGEIWLVRDRLLF